MNRPASNQGTLGSIMKMRVNSIKILFFLLVSLCLKSQSTQNQVDIDKTITEEKRFETLFWQTIGDQVRQGNLKTAYKIMIDSFQLINKFKTEYHDKNFDVLHSYNAKFLQLKNTFQSEEINEYNLTKFYYKVCNTCWLESELRPQYDTYIDKLNRFKVNYPNSDYLDEIEWKLLEITYSDWDEGGRESKIITLKAFYDFLAKYPNSSSACKAEIECFSIVLSLKEKTREEILEMFERLKSKCTNSDSRRSLNNLKTYKIETYRS